MRMMALAMTALSERCIKGITANEDHCRNLVTNSIGVVTALNPVIGYENATRIARKARATGCGVADLVLEEGLLSPAQLADILQPENMTRPRTRAGGSRLECDFRDARPVAKLREATIETITKGVVRERLEAEGAEPVGNTPEEFAAMMKAESARWADLVKQANIKVD